MSTQMATSQIPRDGGAGSNHGPSPARTLQSAKARAELAADERIGAGNFFWRALSTSPAPDDACLWLERPLPAPDGRHRPSLSLRQLADLVRHHAGWYVGRGIKPKDPVAVFMDDGIEYLVHYLALTSIGAIPALINGNMDPKIAAAHSRRIGAVAAFTDDSHYAAFAAAGPLASDQPGFLATAADLRRDPVGDLPKIYPFVHAELDPIMIAHSSGTTGVPKPVLLQHKAFFHGVKYRLGLPQVTGGERILSSLPHSHNAAIAYIMLALMAGTPLLITSDHSGLSVLRQIEKFRPTMVVSFPQTYVEMCEENLDDFDLSSVNLWFNGGDAAHEAHIRKLVRQGSHVRDDERRPGSLFVDGMGSSEMGFSLFRHVHTPETSVFGRCVGTPLPWVDAAVLADDGTKLPAGNVGRLGVKAPTVTTAYWNDSVLTFRSQLAGYWLTGDLVYTDDVGRFFHVDRVPDAIQTQDGPLYSLQTEEKLMRHHPEILDCSVVGAPVPGGPSAAVALIRLRPEAQRDATALKLSFNRVLAEAGMRQLAAVEIVDSAAVPLGTTGKVLKRQLRERYQQYFAART